MAVIVSNNISSSSFSAHWMGIVEAHQTPVLRVMHRQRVLDAMRPLWAGYYALDFKLHPIAAAFVDNVNVAVKIEQVLERVILRSIRAHTPKVIIN